MVKVAREIYANDFIVHNWAGDSTGGLETFTKDLNQLHLPGIGHDHFVAKRTQ
jgi:hypothetical protein